jgi:hypothetical protein
MYSYCYDYVFSFIFMYDYPDWGFSVLFPQLKGKYQGKTHKDGARQALFLIFVLLYLLFVLCRSLYCLCVYVYCTVLYCCHGVAT